MQRRQVSPGGGSGVRSTVAAIVCTAVVAACAAIGPFDPQTRPALTREEIAAIVASPDRSAADRVNDERRKPAELLAFIDPRPAMVALDVSAGGGYTTELLARAIGPLGRVYGQVAPPDPGRRPPAAPEGASAPAAASAAAPMPAPPSPRRTGIDALNERARRPAAANIVAVSRPFDDPIPLGLPPASLDLVTLMFNYHDFGHMGVDRDAMNRAIFAALRPGAAYVIADHAGRPGTGISESGTLHRVEEAFVVREVETAGFRLAARGAFLRNPGDPLDRNTPDPPQPKDEFVLRFVKPSN